MGFVYGVKLPGLDKKIWAKELTSKLYRDLVKSLYNTDSTAFLQHLNFIIEHVSPGILQEDLNVIDKVILLLNMRAISINPDLKLKATCPITKKEFEKNIKIEEVLSKFENFKYNGNVECDGIKISHSIIKAKDEFNFIDIDQEKLFSYRLASSIDSICVDNKDILFKDLSFEERVQVVETLPLNVTTKVQESLSSIEEELSKTKLLSIHSPFAKVYVVDIPVSTNVVVLLEFCKSVFNDDLGNLYRLNFNLVNKAGFTPEYADSIPPSEQLLYWMYFVQQAQKEQQAAEGTSSNNPSFNGSKVGVETPSEFT